MTILKMRLPAGFTISREPASRDAKYAEHKYTLWLYGEQVAVDHVANPLRWLANRMGGAVR